MKNCAGCQKPIKDEALFCPFCGTKQPEKTGNPSFNEEKKAPLRKRVKPWIFIVIGAVLTVVFIVLIAVISSPKAYISDIFSDKIYFIAGEQEDVVITARVEGRAKKVYLLKGQDKIGEMTDDGAGADKNAGDGIYSYKLSFPEYNFEGEAAYHAKAGKNTSKEIILYAFGEPDDEDYSNYLSLINEITLCECLHADENGFVDFENVDDVIDEVEDIIEEYEKKGIVIKHSEGEDYVRAKLASGLTYIYTPKLEDTLFGEGAANIRTFQPHVKEYEKEEYSVLIDQTAKNIGSGMEGFDFTDNVDNDKVTPDSVKSFAANEIILWEGHGAYNPDDHSVIATGQDITFSYWMSNHKDFSKEILVDVNGYAAVTSAFVNKYVGDISGSFIYINTCWGGRDDVLANAFLKKGALAVIANTENISKKYATAMLDRFMLNAFYYTESGEHFTLTRALETSLYEVGENDYDYFARMIGVNNFKNDRSRTCYPRLFLTEGAKDITIWNFVPIENDTENIQNLAAFALGLPYFENASELSKAEMVGGFTTAYWYNYLYFLPGDYNDHTGVFSFSTETAVKYIDDVLSVELPDPNEQFSYVPYEEETIYHASEIWSSGDTFGVAMCDYNHVPEIVRIEKIDALRLKVYFATTSLEGGENVYEADGEYDAIVIKKSGGIHNYTIESYSHEILK